MNANVLVKAIEDVNGDILPTLIDSAFDKVVAEASQKAGEFNKAGLENSLAKMLYLGHLKAEFDQAHGKTEEEKKEWQSQILNELLTDKFEENVQKYKESDIFMQASAKFKNAPFEDFNATACKKMMDEVITGRANDLYYSTCSYFHLGPILPENEKAILDAKHEIDALKITANSIGRKIEDRTGFKNFDEDEHFDTMDLVQRAKLFGETRDSVDKELYKAELREYTQNRIKEEQENVKKEVDKELAAGKKPFPVNDPIMEQMVRGIAESDYVIAVNKQQVREIEEFSKLPQEAKEMEIRKLKVDISNQETKRKTLYSTLRMMYPNKEEFQLSEIIQKFKDTFTPDVERKKMILDRQNKIKGIFESYETGKLHSLRNEELDMSYNGRSYFMGCGRYFRNQEEMDKASAKLDELDRNYKERNKCLYRKIEKDGKVRYERLSHEESKIKMQETYHHLKERYNAKDPSDFVFEKDLANNDKIAEQYKEKIRIEKPDRSTYRMTEYKPALSQLKTGDEPEKGPNPDAIKIAEGIKEPDYTQAVPAERVVKMEADEAIDYAISFGEEYENVFGGTEEYADIMKSLRLIQTNRKENEPAERSIRRMVKALAKMDHYIDRKRDERDASSKEGTNSHNRRLAMENARNMVWNAIDALKAENPKCDRDYTIEKSTDEIENAMKLGKAEDEKVREVVDLMKKAPRDFEGYKQSLNALKKYLVQNVDNYRKDGKYNFRMKEDAEKPEEKRIPKKGNERVFKSALIAFRNLQKSYLKYAEANCPERLAEARFDAKFYQDEKGVFGETNAKFGLNTFIKDYKAEEIGLKATNSIQEYREQFERQYKACINEVKYKNMESILKKDVDASYLPLSEEGKNQLVDSALSLLFLKEYEKKVNENQVQFDFKEMDQLRRQFLTLMRASNVVYGNMKYGAEQYINLKEACPGLSGLQKLKDDKIKAGDEGAFDLRTIDEIAAKYPQEAEKFIVDAKSGPSIDELTALGKQKEDELSVPDGFRNKILPEAMTNWVFINTFSAQMMVSPGGKVDKQSFNKSMQEIDTTLKIAKVLKIDHVVEEKANALLLPGELKGAKLSDSVKLIKDAAMNKMVHKQVEAPKPISL
jgi:hypothetical protein